MSTPLNFQTTFDPPRGVAQDVAPGVRRLVAENPSAMTFKGTNTYLLGTQAPFAVVDPGPADQAHSDAIMRACEGAIEAIIVTHRHPDHVAGLAALVSASRAPVHAHPGMIQRDRPALGIVEAPGQCFSGGLAIDVDHALEDGQVLMGAQGTWGIEAIHTPGHTPDHLALRLVSDPDTDTDTDTDLAPNLTGNPAGVPGDRPVILSGDHVMGWNTSVIAPPAGHMGDYYAALEKLVVRGPARYLPGHGDTIADGHKVARAYL
ncbi:MAG: MBL fold metallo-hydrolase, partial [Pseudomonadota bacterium]